MKENNFDLIDSRSLQFDNNIQHTFSLRFLYHQKECHTTNGDERMWKNVTVRKSGYFRSESLDNFTCQIQLHAQQRGKYLSSLFRILFLISSWQIFKATMSFMETYSVPYTKCKNAITLRNALLFIMLFHYFFHLIIIFSFHCQLFLRISGITKYAA